ncbi:MAG: peptide chain release factor N(5)-glutamine methyltransferase [Thermodesulfobacteriota bacterium]
MTDPKASWTILEILRWTSEYFRAKEVPEPRTSAEVLLAHTLGMSRLDLYLRHDQPLNLDELARFKALVVRRRDGEPVAYITGHREFWSLDLQVTPAVLIPRPETETLVAAAVKVGKEFAKNLGAGLKPAPAQGLEIGVGSGAVIIALAKELPQINWLGVDLSAAALAVARKNASRHEVLHRIHLVQADLLAAFKPKAPFDMLVANLPYVPQAEWEQLPRDIKDFEPRSALLGGKDGLDLIRPLIEQAQQYVKDGGWVLLEVGDGQAQPAATLFTETGAYDWVEKIRDFNGVERVVRARRRAASFL